MKPVAVPGPARRRALAALVTGMAALLACHWSAAQQPPLGTHPIAAAAVLVNQLADSASPYLRMHGNDPVRWQVWGEAALRRARDEHKPLFVSIGYFSCHWCHVMHRESFQDSGIAKLLNKRFVPVKVDRELNPALDSHLIEFVQATQGRAGWPLNVFLTPEGYPVLGTVYLSRNGFASVLEGLSERWSEDSKGLVAMAREASRLLAAERVPNRDAMADGLSAESVIGAFREQVQRAGDHLGGGFGAQSKFPSVAQLTTLLHLSADALETQERRFVLLTLNRMERLALRDQVAGGFFRYVTDPDWQSPHFEKMLYDNAQLVELYALASQVFSGRQGRRFAAIAINTASFMLREMSDPDGGFIASLSAVDSHGREGGPYQTDHDELARILSEAQLQAAVLAWGLDQPPGPHGRYLIIGRRSPEEVAARLNSTPSEVRLHLRDALRSLRAARRAHPVPRDGKRLAGWNGLALSALVRAVSIGGGETFEAAARNVRDYVVSELIDGEKVSRMRDRGTARGAAGLRDYVYLARGLLDWAELTQSTADRRIAVRLLQAARQRFFDASGWRLSETSLLANAPAYRLMIDGPLPSATALWAESVLRLGEEKGMGSLARAARGQLAAYPPELVESAFFHATHIRLLIDQSRGRL